MDMSLIFEIAVHELKINIRNRWTTIFAFVFGLLVTSIAYFGLMTEGFAGMQDFTRTSALIMGTLSFTGDRGSMELLFSQPLSRAEVVVGKLLGVFLSIAMATLLGFTVAGVLVVAGHGPEGLARYAAMVGFSLLLALAFLSLALLVATVAHRKPPAIGVSLFLWFFFVLFYDILAIALTLFLRGESANVAIFLSVFGNPVDMVRVATLVMLDNVTIFGAAGAAMLRFLGGTATAIAAVLAALLLWILIPVGISCGILGGQDI
jgi:Cu-processing system permease protein